MHIIIGLITAIAGLLWAINSVQRAGLDLGWLNPFAWRHRRQWRQRSQQVPIHNLKNSMEAAAVILVGALKQEGDLTREQKLFAIHTFKETFKLSENDAAELFGSCTFLLTGVTTDIDEHIESIIAPVKSEFTPAQINALVDIVTTAISLDGAPTNGQEQTLANLKKEFELQKVDHQW